MEKAGKVHEFVTARLSEIQDLCRQFEIIGEALNHLSKAFLPGNIWLNWASVTTKPDGEDGLIVPPQAPCYSRAPS